MTFDLSPLQSGSSQEQSELKNWTFEKIRVMRASPKGRHFHAEPSVFGSAPELLKNIPVILPQKLRTNSQ
ncbi:MAG: hypothetical protein Q4E59_04465, partial [Bacteroidales bacterium]|nr:hypothetical protein [Bacteroidales bacterium]